MKFRHMIVMLVLAALVLPLNLSNAVAFQGGTLASVLASGEVRVGFANEAPFAFARPDGTLDGEAVKVAERVFQILAEQNGLEGIEMVGVLSTFGSLIPGLQAGRFDVITAGMFINPGRCEQVLFADPEYTIGEGLAVKAGNPLGLNSYEDIAANPDVRVGTGAGFAEFDIMQQVGVSEDQITLFDTNEDGIAALQADRIDAYTATSAAITAVLEAVGDDSLEKADFSQPIVDGMVVANFGGAAFRLEDRDFRDAFTEALNSLKESGELAEILESVEGFSSTGGEAAPADVTTADLCPGTPNDP